jgi:hypothetical protein
MIEGFDKEMDALLRQTVKSETALANDNLKSAILNPKSEIHLNADEISAFAENALPERAKLKYTAHFADCDRCRTILSNLIELNSEAETIAASSIVSPQIVETRAIPWHRKLFAFPNLAYTMGALVVLFGGFIAFTVVRNVNEATGSQSISQIPESQRSTGGPSFDGETELLIPNAAANTMSNAMSSNATSANTSSNLMMSNTALATAANSTSVSNNFAARTANANASVSQTPRAAAPQPAPPAIAQAAPPTQAETFSTDAAGSSAARISENEKKTADRKADTEKTEVKQDAPRSDSSALSARNTTSTTGKDSNSLKTKARNQKSPGAEIRQIGGKTFTRKEGVWYDGNYNGQPTTNISRGSNDYKKLDSDLRSVAGSLNGTVVLVWKNKAYRIQ